PLALLPLAAITVDDAGDEIVDHDDGRRGAIAGRYFLASDRHGRVVETGAAPLFRHRDAIEAHRRQALQRFARELVVAIPARGVRRELLASIATHGVPDFLMFHQPGRT